MIDDLPELLTPAEVARQAAEAANLGVRMLRFRSPRQMAAWLATESPISRSRPWGDP